MNRSSANWRRWIETWYLAYALLGVAAAGMIPILIPIAVARSGSVGQVGLVVAVISLGGLTAPLWGTLADRYRLHRWLLAGGLLAATLGLALFPLAHSLGAWVGLAFLQGAGVTGSATVANLFVIEAHPKGEWDERIGWLQSFYGVGQVVGLLLAGFLAQAILGLSLTIAAAFTLAGALLGWLTTKTPPRPAEIRPALLHPARHSEWAFGSPQRHYHMGWLKALSNLGGPFGAFLLVWLIAFSGSATLFSLYPLVMANTFNINPGISSAGFAVAAALGLVLYTPAGVWSERMGAGRVITIGLAIRLAAFVALIGLGLSGFAARGWLALACFAAIVLAWSLLSVSSTALTASLSPAGQGEALGLYNAVTALAGVVGAGLGGWIAGALGYGMVSVVAAAGVGVGLLLWILFNPAHRVNREEASQ